MDTVLTRIVATAFLILTLTGCKPGGEAVRPPVRLGEEVKDMVATALAGVNSPVILHYYEGGKGETGGPETKALLKFMAETSPQISVSSYSLDNGPSTAEIRSTLGVSHGPAIRIEGIGQSTFFFFGYPERKELKPFLDGVVIASGGPANLPAEVEDFLANIHDEVLIKIFTTPDWSFCPEPVRLAYAFASRNEKVKPLVFASHQYPEESRAFGVVTVPKIWINDKVFIDGTAPTREMMAFTLAAMIRQAQDDSIPKGKFKITEE